MALAISVFALVVIGALVTGAFYAGRVEQRTSGNALHQAQALGAAEAGVDATIANWNIFTYNNMAVGDSMILPTITLGGGNFCTPTINRLNEGIFLIRSEGQYQGVLGNVLGRRLVASITRLNTPEIDIQAALTVQGSLTLGGTTEIDGADHIPGGWGGCPVADTVAGIRISTNDITTNGANCSGNPPACVDGDPPVNVDTTVTPSTFTQFGSLTFADLAATANFTINGTLNGVQPTVIPPPVGSPPGTPATCDRGNNTNWGEPYRGLGTVPECAGYYPILYAPGDVHINGGRGQGILLVAGNLELSGGVEFFGPVIVLGNVRSTGVGGHVYGALLAQNADLDPTTIVGNSVVNYSACAVLRALQGSANVVPLASRSWAQLY